MDVIARTVTQARSSQGAVNNLIALKQRFNDILVGHHGAVLNVARQDGRTLFANPGNSDLFQIISTTLGNNGDDLVQNWSDADHTYRILTQHVNNTASTSEGDYTVSVAVAIDYHLHFLQDFHRTLWLMIASSIVLMGLMGWIAVRQGHAPLHNIVSQIQRISAN